MYDPIVLESSRIAKGAGLDSVIEGMLERASCSGSQEEGWYQPPKQGTGPASGELMNL
jgi:hypothetical protein